MRDSLAEARRYYRRKQFLLAAEKYREVMEQEPDRSAGYLGLARSLFYLGRYDEAIRICHHGLALGTEEVWFHDLLGDVYGKLRRHEQCDQEFQRAIELAGTATEPYVLYGVELMDRRQFDQAEILLKKAIEIDPRDGIATYDLAIVYASQGRKAEAARLARRAFRLRPSIRTCSVVVKSFNDEFPLALALITALVGIGFWILGLPYLFWLVLILIDLRMAVERFRMGEKANPAVYLALIVLLLLFSPYGKS